MKLALLTYEYEPSIGGIGTLVKQTALALAARGHEVHVICPDYGLSIAELPDAGFPIARERSARDDRFVLRFPAMRTMGSPIDMLRAARSIRDTLHSIRPDWVLLMDLHAQLQAGILARFGQPLASVGTAAWFHGSELHHLRVGKLARAFGVPALDRCRVLFVNSHDTMERVKRTAPERWLSKSILGGVGVSPEFLSAGRDAEAERRVREQWDIPDDALVLLTVARLVPRKGIDRSLEAVAALGTGLRSRCRYIIVGTGPSEGDLRRQVERLGLEGIVRFTGPVGSSELITFYDLADLYVQASRTVGGDVEGLGVSFLEAAARSVPSLGFRHGGVPEAVKHGTTGILVEEDDVAALSAALDSLLRDDERRITMGRGARAHVEEHFQWSLVAERVEHALLGAATSEQTGSLDILVVSAKWPPLHTGAGLQARAMLKRLGSAIQVRVLTLGFHGAVRREESDRFLVERIGSIESGPRPARVFGTAVARRLASIRPPQLLWVLGVGTATYAAILVGRMRRIPVLVKLTLEGQDDTETLRRKFAGSIRVRLLRSATLVCPSTRLRRLALEMGFPPERVVHIPNGVDLSRFAGLPESRDPAQIAFVGVVLERKGLHIVIEAMAELKEEYPALRLAVIGEWPQTGDAPQRAYMERLRARITSAGLSDRVTIVGSVETPEEWLLRSSIFVLPSEAEGLPNALLEAMAAGAVPVVSDLPALREVVEDHRNGIVVPERSAQAWAEAIRSLLRDPASIETMSRAARATIRDRHDLSTVAQSYLELFRSVTRR